MAPSLRSRSSQTFGCCSILLSRRSLHWFSVVMLRTATEQTSARIEMETDAMAAQFDLGRGSADLVFSTSNGGNSGIGKHPVAANHHYVLPTTSGRSQQTNQL